MPAQPSLEVLRRDLLRRGLPTDYVERVIGEWADHLEDLSTAQFSKEAEMPQTSPLAYLGDESELVDTTVLEYRKRTFAGRHPIWTFLVAPIPLVLLCWIAYYASVVLFVFATGEGFLHRQSATQHAVLQFLFQASLQAPPIAATVFLAWLAHRGGQKWWWFATACTMVALFAACHHTSFDLPVGRGKGSLAIGFGNKLHAAQLAAPLLAGAVLLWWYSRKPTAPDGSSPESMPSEPLRQAA